MWSVCRPLCMWKVEYIQEKLAQEDRWTEFTFLLQKCLIWASWFATLLLLSSGPPGKLLFLQWPIYTCCCDRNQTKLKLREQVGSQRCITVSHNATCVVKCLPVATEVMYQSIWADFTCTPFSSSVFEHRPKCAPLSTKVKLILKWSIQQNQRPTL